MRYGWLTSMNRQRHQRAINDIVRQINKNVYNDPLWKGRFYVRQKAAQWFMYEDKSGAELWVVLELIDRKTGFSRIIADTVNHWRYFNGSHMWQEMNNFIIDSGVWEEDPRPTYENTPNYR